MLFKEIKLLDTVSNTISGDEGELLRDAVNDSLEVSQGVLISFRGHGPLSDEFVRKSFGSLLEKLGHEVFLRYIRISGTHLSIEDIFCLGVTMGSA